MSARPTLKPGQRVKAFHPATLGVVKEGAVVKNGSKYVHVDFGELNGGVRRVPHRDVVEVM